MILRVDSEARVGGRVVRRETRYFVTSLSPEEVGPKRLTRLVRGHWEVENGLHYISVVLE